jgi:hypothetical protein
MTLYLDEKWGLGPKDYEDESPTYEVEFEGQRVRCVGHDALLYFLSYNRERPMTVRRTDWPSVVNHYVEEHAIQAAVTDRETGEVRING